MKATIWKYPLVITDVNSIHVPRHAQLICALCQNDQPYLWFMVDPEQPKETIIINMVGTGHEFNTQTIGEYFATVPTHNGKFIWHLFKELK